MDTLDKITCPNCGHHFNAEQALAQEVESKLRAEFNHKFKGLRSQLEKELEQKEEENRRNLVEEKRRLELSLKEKVKQDYELVLKNAQEELDIKRKENYELKNRELDLMKKERALAEQKNELEISLQKKLMEERKIIEEQARRRSDEENQMRLREKDMRLEQLMEQLEVMKKKAEQGSMQLQGEVQEVVLEELLKSVFPFDTISEVGKGVKGADVIQVIRNNIGKECGTIIYESKRTKSFSDSWIEKLKQDLRSHKSDIAVIVTETMPKGMDKFGQKEGIWVCTYSEVQGVAAVLRESLIQIYDIRCSQENRGDKMHLLYDFLTGNEFKQYIEAIVDSFSCMQQGLNKEKLAMERMWSEREKQLHKVLLNMSGMYGSIKGIAGSAVAEVKLLDINQLGIEE